MTFATGIFSQRELLFGHFIVLVYITNHKSGCYLIFFLVIRLQTTNTKPRKLIAPNKLNGPTLYLS
jgi:hypothetical protein